MSGQWKKLSNYTVEHVSGSRVNKINEDKFEVWMLDENRKYFHAGMFADRNQVLRIAAEHDIGAARERRAKAQLNAEWVAENESGEAVTPAKWA